jgi:hypothetical protein
MCVHVHTPQELGAFARFSRRVWAARKGLIGMPMITAEQAEVVSRLLDPVVSAPCAP